MPAALITMKTIREPYPNQFQFVTYANVGCLAQLSGDTDADEYLEDRLSLEELLTDWEAQSADFAAEVQAPRNTINKRGGTDRVLQQERRLESQHGGLDAR